MFAFLFLDDSDSSHRALEYLSHGEPKRADFSGALHF
jgi:hypothetical protein